MNGGPLSATGIWTAVYFGGSGKFCAGVSGEDIGLEKDRSILADLARKVRVLSERPREQEKRHLWFDHNDLKERYPVVLADPENGWNEIVTGDMLRCTAGLARRWEWILRREIFWGEQLCDDRPIERVFNIGHTYTDTGWGLDVVYHGGRDGSAYRWEPALADMGDIDRIREPCITVDRETTERTLDLARSILGGELEVKLRGLNLDSPSPHMSRDLTKLLGLQTTMMKLVDDPETIHRIMRKLLQGHQARLDFLEDNGLLSLNNDHSYVGSGGIGYTRELPRRRMAPGDRVRTEDLWLLTESQETVGISPEMFAEFIHPYEVPLQERFGLNCYGCCEPLDSRWHIIRGVPNLRRASVSPWADEEKMAAALGGSCIYSRKPNPAHLATPRMDEQGARLSIRRTLETTRGGCIVEFVMKDNHTIGGNPGNVVRWVEIAREEIERVYGKR